MKCEYCNQEFKQNSNCQKYCINCRPKVRKGYERKYICVPTFGKKGINKIKVDNDVLVLKDMKYVKEATICVLDDCIKNPRKYL